MDTIAIRLNLDYTQGVTTQALSYIDNYIANIRSEYGYTYCDILKIDNATGEIIMKVSYPRYFSRTNAHLITTEAECQQVQNSLICALTYGNFNYKVSSITLIRLDIPFTYLMSEQEYFHNYQNIYKVFALIYKIKNPNSDPKMISQIISGRSETLTYADTRSMSNYNSKIMIYNQYLNIENKTECEIFNGIVTSYPDLSKRIRIEVSKRIKRKDITLEEFRYHTFYTEYSIKYKEYLNKNIFDSEVLENLYTREAKESAHRLIQERETPSFKYEVFILNNLKYIYDYEIIRRALCIAIGNTKTREGAITTVRKILSQYQNSNELIVMNTYAHIREMRRQLQIY